MNTSTPKRSIIPPAGGCRIVTTHGNLVDKSGQVIGTYVNKQVFPVADKKGKR
jgi:hypothetical protein